MVESIEIIFKVLNMYEDWKLILNVFAFSLKQITTFDIKLHLLWTTFLCFHSIPFQIDQEFRSSFFTSPSNQLKSSLNIHFFSHLQIQFHSSAKSRNCLHTHSPIICYANSFFFSLSRQFILFVVYLQHQMCFKIYDNHITCGFCMCEKTKKNRSLNSLGSFHWEILFRSFLMQQIKQNREKKYSAKYVKKRQKANKKKHGRGFLKRLRKWPR